MKTRILFILFFLAIQSFAFAQKNKPSATSAKPVDFAIPLTPEKWAFQTGKVEFVDYEGQKSMKIAPNSGQVVLKDLVFKDGTIEFDVEPVLPEFAQSFGDADLVVVCDIYSAGEPDLGQISGQKVADLIAKEGRKVEFQASLESVSKFLTQNLQPGDLALFLGAGNLNQIIPEVMAFYQQAMGW